ncbi:ethanolamine ammonia-lyase subunit EutC [Thalassospira marina]|uniref:Ethanolamine ammonia-lyase small subunit n=1 Tax=Thalassospira marina TaxID=2048283 RepID=A0ABM6QHS4_9PROT|nr:ethanolamine ammonia-lyase subunit EutC [Thalassospira marina]AUG55967.1 ethanolamine ammonia-lyase [Thalassospira marina]
MTVSDNTHIPRLDPWSRLRVHTSARIGLGRVGDGLPTSQLLEFQMAHARARDSVHMPFEGENLARDIAGLGLPVVPVQSRAANRAEYLQRPDYGRTLDEDSKARLLSVQGNAATEGLAAGDYDVVFILADGLSARAVHENGAEMLRQSLGLLDESWKIGPVVIASQARVALGDEIARRLQAKISIILIGERPGLSSADSLGAYLTWAPKPGCSNAQRNCISNIRPAGFPLGEAARKLVYLMAEARKNGLSGVHLKDNYSALHLVEAPSPALPE